MKLYDLTLAEASEGLGQGAFSSHELVTTLLDRVGKQNKKLNAYLTVTAEEALEAAKAADNRRKAGEVGALLGVPIAIKDNLSTVGVRTTAASKILEHFIPAYDATAVRKVKEAGAVMLGKTNLDEFGHGASTDNSAFGATRNPWDSERVAGGSSGGSAAAVAAGMALGALGTDTGGSIRYPAGFCGVVGLRPSYGLVSRSGLLSMTSSTDTVGPLARTVRDTALLLEGIAGSDADDQTTYPTTPVAYSKTLTDATLKGVAIGVPRDFVEREGVTEGVLSAFRAAMKACEKAGAKIVAVSLPHAHYGISAYYIITPSEISANLARYDGMRYGHRSNAAKNLFEVYAKSRGEGFGAEPKRRIMLGTYALSTGYYDAYYLTAQKVRTLITRELDETLQHVDVIATPISPHVAFRVGSKDGDPLKMYLEDIFMSPAALAGLPAISVPAGFAAPEDGGSTELPVGLQFIGRRFDEAKLLGVAYRYEQMSSWHKQRPKF